MFDSEEEKVIGVKYSRDPEVEKRNMRDEDKKIHIPNYKNKKVKDKKGEEKLSDTLWAHKLEFPLKFVKPFKFLVKTNIATYDFSLVVKQSQVKQFDPCAYYWNIANIEGFLQVICWCSSDDRRVQLSSGLHDALLEFKEDYYMQALKSRNDITPDEYRRLTSEIFGYVTKTQGMGDKKADTMKSSVDFFQKNIVKDEWECLDAIFQKVLYT